MWGGMQNLLNGPRILCYCFLDERFGTIGTYPSYNIDPVDSVDLNF